MQSPFVQDRDIGILPVFTSQDLDGRVVTALTEALPTDSDQGWRAVGLVYVGLSCCDSRNLMAVLSYQNQPLVLSSLAMGKHLAGE